MQELFDKLLRFIPLSPEASDFIMEVADMREFSKGDVLIKPGDKVNKTFFILDGCMRSFFVDHEERQHTLQFALKDWWISDFIALYNQEAASVFVECIKKTRLVEFYMDDLEWGYLRFPEFERFQRMSMEKHVGHLHQRILNQLRLSAKERYELFLKQYPDIERHVPNYQIASYLGITKESLSRIRSDLLTYDN